MNDQQLREEALPRVARCIPLPVEELTLYHPHYNEVHDCARATIYWGSLYICEVEVKGSTLVLHSWRPMYRDRGRIEWEV